MMRNNKLMPIFIVLLCLILLSSCSDYLKSNNDRYSGETVDKEKLSSIADSVTDEEDSGSERGEHDGVYYWTQKSTVYHKWADCRYLKNASEVFEGNITEAFLAGKHSLCSDCAK